MPDYTVDDVSLLTTIRNDILARPDFYAPGAKFLAERFGAERLHRDALADWEKWKDHPTQRASNRAVAEDRTRGISDPAERQARYAEVLVQLSAPPKLEKWTPYARLTCAVQKLLDEPGGEHHDAKAQAVLILAVLLWDADADKRHRIFAAFGPWGATPDGEVESSSRWVATFHLDDKNDLRNWMDKVHAAWTALPKQEPFQAASAGAAPPPAAGAAGQAGKAGGVSPAVAGKAAKPKKRKVGRVPVSVGEARKRRNIVAKYKKRKGATQKDFCQHEGIELAYLKNCLVWERMRNHRSANKLASIAH